MFALYLSVYPFNYFQSNYSIRPSTIQYQRYKTAWPRNNWSWRTN